jgi:GR25 family glycosyltransferase involved in LPS biosynthesis
LKYAKENDFECIAIFEDDVIFAPNYAKDFHYYLSVLPDNWHILYLGGVFQRKPLYFNNDFTQQVQTWGAFAYVVHKRAYDKLINLLERPIKIVDGHYIDYQKLHLCIKPNKRLVIHPQGYSTIKERDVNYSNIV